MNLLLIAVFVHSAATRTVTALPGDRARQKCLEYGQLVFQQTTAKEETPTSVCDIVATPLVVGGERATPGEFPHMAHIGYGRPTVGGWHCGGSLISEIFVLTAAHCAKHREDGEASAVRLGAVDEETMENVQEIDISEILVHPEYKTREKYHDICLMKLVRPPLLNEFVRPACLNVDPDYKWEKAFAIGFGRTSFDAPSDSPVLLKVRLSLIDSNTCGEAYKNEPHISEGIAPTQFCAGDLQGGRDTCQGDSGGPIQIVLREPYCMYNILGITSLGKFCGFSNSPGVYTRLSSYTEWVESKVWP